MFKQLSALRIYNVMIISLLPIFFVAILINKFELTRDLWLSIVGFIHVCRPTLGWEAIEEMAKRSGSVFKPMMTEKLYKITAVVGGLAFIIIGLSDIFFNWL